MRILIIGSGGREHALAWRLAKSRHSILSAPGNPGMAELGDTFATSNYLDLAREKDVDLTIVGPELPLAAGVVDRFRAESRAIVGPTHDCARLESSKIYSKNFMEQLGLPTARSVRVNTVEDAMEALVSFPFPVVIKADGLQAGKGVIIAEDSAQSISAVVRLGPRLVIEEFLEGEEVSFIALCDGRTAIALEPTQDHKRIGDGDTGPNTGGMGAYCDTRILDNRESDRLLESIILPVVRKSGFTGFLYAGLMMTADGPKVLEFNVRLGDPETQPLMHRLDCDFAEALLASAQGSLGGIRLNWQKDPSVCVVLSAGGYPGTPRTGDLITGIGDCPGVVFQAGTRKTERGLETAGGRVLGVTASGASLADAIRNTYAAVEHIRFDGMHYRRDIGQRGLKRWAAE
ncbi:MAG: phosphoribosylamine--glycine ligase [Bryobacteraceae bacterium]|nr:phosphoribosylamine--glycine ligase [Bryobacteraceae bacterium]